MINRKYQIERYIVSETNDSRIVIHAGFDITNSTSPYWTITAEHYISGVRECISCGCLHEDILETMPELKPLVDVHLCNNLGINMYAVENFKYHFENKEFEKCAKIFGCSIEDVHRPFEELRAEMVTRGFERVKIARELLESYPVIEVPKTFLESRLDKLGITMKLKEEWMEKDQLHYKFEIKFGKRRITQKLYTGILFGKVKLTDVVNCVMSDIECVESGDDLDEKTLKQIELQEKKWRKFLGSEFDSVKCPVKE